MRGSKPVPSNPLADALAYQLEDLRIFIANLTEVGTAFTLLNVILAETVVHI